MKQAILFCFLFISAQNFAQNLKPLSKDSMLELYNSYYLSSEIKSMPWNGSLNGCKCGSLDSSIYSKATARINFFRQIYGLGPVKMNAASNKKAQAAALLSKANEELTHNPTKTAKCYSKDADEGCQGSCLSFTDFNSYQPGFLTGFMQDYGDENYFIGHRRWMLYSKLVEVGYGATDNAEALYTVGGVSFDDLEVPDCVPYPWPGAVPENLIFPKWSFSIPDKYKVDFSQAIVTMKTEGGQVINLEILEVLENYLDHTLVWSAKGMFDYSDGEPYMTTELDDYIDKKIKVSIKNVMVDGKKKNYDYYVMPVRIEN